MTLAVSALNGVKVYNLAAGRTLPEWQKSAEDGRSLRYNDEFRRRLELIQEFAFPTASTQIALSPDGRYIVACGVYRPQVKVFDLDQLGLKFERHSDAEIVALSVLADDYTKMALLRADRTLELHAKHGLLHSVRVPKFARALAYNPANADLMAGGCGPDLYRLNLELGQFQDGFRTDFDDVNRIEVNPLHQLVAVAGDRSTVEFWDPRDRTRAASLRARHDGATSFDITAFQFAMDGLTFVAGTSTGHCLLYDLRSSRPLLDKDHRNGLAVRDVRLHEASRQVVSTDGAAIKIWDRASGAPLTSIEAGAPVHQLCLVQGTGLLFAAAEQHRVPTYYIPELGPAPRWCSFLDNLTEELEEEARTSAFDDYKFVTRAELGQLGLLDLVGSNLLRAYMHGFFMDMRLWRKVKSVADPFAYETYVQKRVQEKVEARRRDRITVARRLPKINTDYAEALLQADPTKTTTAGNPLGDARFGAMFMDSEFAIDKDDEEFRRLRAANAKLDGPRQTTEEVKKFLMADESESEAASDDSDDPFSSRPPSRQRPKPKRVPQMVEVRQQEIGLPLQRDEGQGGGGGRRRVELDRRQRKRSLLDRATQLKMQKQQEKQEMTTAAVPDRAATNGRDRSRRAANF